MQHVQYSSYSTKNMQISLQSLTLFLELQDEENVNRSNSRRSAALKQPKGSNLKLQHPQEHWLFWASLSLSILVTISVVIIIIQIILHFLRQLPIVTCHTPTMQSSIITHHSVTHHLAHKRTKCLRDGSSIGDLRCKTEVNLDIHPINNCLYSV